jgi:hypothetical protein
MPRNDATLPITYSIDRSLGVIFEVWRGDVTADDLGRYWTAYLENPEVLELRRTLVDLRAAEIQFTGSEMLHLVSSIVLPVLNGRDWKTAIVVQKPAQFGLSKQYHFFAEQYSTDSIFFEPEPALSWLLAQGDGKRA